MKYLCATAIALMAPISLHAQKLTNKCLPASFINAKSTSLESFSDDFGNFFEFKGVKYGMSLQGEGYVGVDDARVMVSAIRFVDLKGNVVALRPDDLAISRAVAYQSKTDKSIVCVLSSFSGLGSSGGFQHLAGLIAVAKPHGPSPLRAEGAIVRVK